jgi:hypothetical protein
MTTHQLDRILSELSRLHAEADAVIDTYVRHIRQRDDLGAIPPDCIRQTQIEGRAGVCMDARHALQLIRADLAGAKAAPTAVSVITPKLLWKGGSLIYGVQNHEAPVYALSVTTCGLSHRSRAPL